MRSNQMEDYQERVLVEQKELGEKIVKLTTFITDFNKVKVLDEQEWKYLNAQLEAMLEYNLVLMMRIRNFKE
jgi:hypothetical protein